MIQNSERESGSDSISKIKAPPRARRIGVSKAVPAKVLTRRQKTTNDKRENILSAAQTLFSRFGLHGTSIDRIAEKADISKSNLLYYFANKEDLYVNVLRSLLAVWLEPLRDFDTDSVPEEALNNYVRRKLVLSRDFPEESRLFCLEIVQGAPLLKAELTSGLRDLVNHKSLVIQSWIDRGLLNRVDPHHFIFSIWAITQHYADFATQVEAVSGKTLKNKAFFEETVHNVQQIILRGVLPRQEVQLASTELLKIS